MARDPEGQPVDGGGGLLTDLYQLTMAQSYFEHGMAGQATFSLLIRRYPPDRGYFVSAGLQDVLELLRGLSFSNGDLQYLESTGIFSQRFLHYLSTLRFTGSVRAVPEGRLFFPDEPVLEVTAPIVEGQLVETFVINQVNLQSMLATKASRCVYAAEGRPVIDFSFRRTHGIDAGHKAARCAYLVGVEATSNVEAGRLYGLPVAGTMAHSFVTSFDHEIDSFRAFVHSFPDRSLLLIDTYDTIEGARKAVQVAKEMAKRGQRLLGVRLDSGDLLELSRQVRELLDREGLRDVGILASGGLDEHGIGELVAHGAPVDSFAVGTKMGVSADAPWTDMAYKLVRYEDRPLLKLSAGKATLPDAKQILRLRDRQGRFHHDLLALWDEEPAVGEPLLETVMQGGQPLGPLPDLAASRRRFQEEFAALPERFKALRGPPSYPVERSPRLRALLRKTEARIEAEELGGKGQPR